MFNMFMKNEIKLINGGTLGNSSQIAEKHVDSFEIGIYLVTFAEWSVVRKFAIEKIFDFRTGRAGG